MATEGTAERHEAEERLEVFSFLGKFAERYLQLSLLNFTTTQTLTLIYSLSQRAAASRLDKLFLDGASLHGELPVVKLKAGSCLVG